MNHGASSWSRITTSARPAQHFTVYRLPLLPTLLTASQGPGGRERYLNSTRKWSRGDDLPEVSPLKPQSSCSPPCPRWHGTAEQWAPLSSQGKGVQGPSQCPCPPPPCPCPASAAQVAHISRRPFARSLHHPPTPRVLCISVLSHSLGTPVLTPSPGPENSARRGYQSKGGPGLPYLKAKPGDTAQSSSLPCGLPAQTLHPAEGRPC